MKKFLDFMNKWGVIILVAFALLILMKDCSTAKKVRKLEKANVEITAKLDSLNNKTLNANDVTKLIKTVSASQTLIDEELVDKKQLTLTDLYKQIQ